eukprot:TRINITY_DN13331_c0_g1_i1.p1 TRINITY_DN13331_c0_g1~~TRINITY_DN13331_c0_g1_i1.p1  ORF type:complete len:390 (+),score=59.75 TRINITY_DN13331_c0_g1_i1:102-1271(+)
MFMQESGRDFHGGVGYAAEQRDASEGDEGQGGDSSEGSQAEASENEEQPEEYLARQDRHEEEPGEKVHRATPRAVSEGPRPLDSTPAPPHSFGIYITPGSALETNGSLGSPFTGPGLLRQLREQQQAGAQISLHDSLRGNGESESNFTSLLTSGGSGDSQKAKDSRSSVDVPTIQRKPRLLELDSMENMEPSLKYVLSDPSSGHLMEDATIFSCGHTFGCEGLQRVIQTSECLTCRAVVSTKTMAPNHALRAVVEAFKRENEFQKLSMTRLSKRRRERYDQDQGSQGEGSPSDVPKAKGVQFPFVVADRVLIKGNKRTPGRFVGREAIITTQCLNGWYLVRTLDNGESVRLQYRSLQKVGGLERNRAIDSSDCLLQVAQLLQRESESSV